MEKIESILNKLPQQSQSQESLLKQLKELRQIANRLGLYDASDFIGRVVKD
jgi:hypothetical protein